MPPVEIPEQPQVEDVGSAPPPPPEDYRSRYADLTPETAPLPPPTGGLVAEDFRNRYSDLSLTPATDEVAPIPTPAADDFRSRYADIGNDNVTTTASVVDQMPEVPPEAPIINPREEEISPTPYNEGMLNWMRRSTEEFLAPGQESGATLISPETADLVAAQMGLTGRVVAKGMEKLTGLPYTKAQPGFEKAVSEALQGFTSLEGIASLANPFMLEAFAVNTITNLPEQFGRIKEAVQTHGFISKETAKAMGDAGIADAFGWLALKGGVAKQRKLYYKKEAPKPGGIVADEATGKAMADQFGMTFKGVQKTPEGLPDFLMFEDPVAGGTIAKEGDTVSDFGTHLEQKRATFKGGEKPSAIEEGKVTEDIRQKPEDRVEGRETKEAGVSDRIQPAAEVRAKEVKEPAIGEAIDHPIVGTEIEIPVVNRHGAKPVIGRIRITGIKRGPDTRGGSQTVEVTFSDGSSTRTNAGKQSDGAFVPWSEAVDGIIENKKKTESGAREGQKFGPISEPTSAELGKETPSEPSIAAPAVEPAVPGAGGAMGAAGAKEKLATYEERKFGKRLASDEELVSSFKEDLGNKFYEPITNVNTFENAVALVNERGIPESIRIMKDKTNGLPPHIRSAMGQYMIKRLNATIKNLGESPDAVRLQNHAIDTAEWLMEYGTELGQGVQSFAAYDRLTPEGKLIKARQDAKKVGVKLTPEQEAEIIRLAREIEQAPEGDPRNKANLAMNKYMANIEGFDSKDLILGVYYGNMLSGYNTQIVNALDTFLNVNSEVNGLAMTNPKAAMTIYGGLLRGFGRGSIDALHALTEGRMATDLKYLDQPRLMEMAKFGQKGGVPIKVKGIVSAGAKRFAESKLGYPLNAWKYVSRLMTASDTVMYRAAQEAKSALLAHRLAVSEGMHGKALHNRVNEILGLDVKATQSFKQQAISEGYKGAKLKSRVAELSRLSRPEDFAADTADFAGEATYNHKPHGFLGYLGDTAAKVTTKVPALKVVVPFTQIVANVTNRGLNYSPYGFKRAFYGYSFEKPLEGEARSAMLMRATMGTAALGIILGAKEAGLLDVHGAGPSDREKRRQLLNTGWKPYSFQVGNHYFSYLPTPVGLEMSVMGNMIDSYRYNELGQKDAWTRAGYAFSRLGSTVFSQSFLNGTSTMFGALSGTSPGETLSSIKQFISGTAGAFLSPRIVTDIQRLFDPKSYRSDNILGDLLRNTPFTSLVNKPTLNAFGEPVILPNNRFVSKETEDPVWQFVARTGIRISVPSRTTTVPDGEGGKRRITPEEYYGYLQDSGQQLKEYISNHMDTLEGMDQEDLQDKLSEEAKRIRKSVKAQQF